MAKRIITLTVAAILGIAALTYGLFRTGYVRFNYPPADRYPIRGIDVSRHQGSIDWPIVRDADVDFAFIKASEGADLRDSRFAENWRGARALRARSAYHFFTFCSPGRGQAENFLRATRTSGADLPPAVDIEFQGNCKAWRSIPRIRSELKRFLEYVESKSGTAPILYVTLESYGRIVRGHFDRYPLWLREVVTQPSRRTFRRLVFWQYAGNGRVPGIDTLVDLNAFVGSRKEFEELVSDRSR